MTDGLRPAPGSKFLGRTNRALGKLSSSFDRSQGGTRSRPPLGRSSLAKLRASESIRRFCSLRVLSVAFLLVNLLDCSGLAFRRTHAYSNVELGRESRQSPRRHLRRSRRDARHPRCPCGIAAQKPDISNDQSKVVRVEVSVDEHGNLIAASAITGRKDLRERGEAEARRMKFEAAMVNGRAIGRIKIVVFDYSDSTP
jgi:hypothetical protein